MHFCRNSFPGSAPAGPHTLTVGAMCCVPHNEPCPKHGGVATILPWSWGDDQGVGWLPGGITDRDPAPWVTGPQICASSWKGLMSGRRQFVVEQETLRMRPFCKCLYKEGAAITKMTLLLLHLRLSVRSHAHNTSADNQCNM